MDVINIFIVIAALFFIFRYYLSSNFNFWKSRNVKGPQPQLFFGNYKQIILGKLNECEYLEKLCDYYKNEPVIGIFFMRSPTLVLKDFEIIKDVLIRDFNSFSDRGFRVVEEVSPMSTHLFAVETERWRPLRQKISPIFTSSKLKDMFNLINECAEHFEKYAIEMLNKSDIVEVRELTAKFTTDVIGVCAFGLNTNCLGDEANEFRKVGKSVFDIDLVKFLRFLSIENLPLSVLKYLKTILYDKETNDFFLNLMKETIDYRTKNNFARQDFVDLLMDIKKHPEKLGFDFNHEILTAQAFVFFAAGFETSSTTISNALLELALNPQIQETLRQEIKSDLEKNNGKIEYDTVKSMKYLDMVFKETLRKYPPLPVLVRKSNTEYKFRGTKITIPENTKVVIPVLSIHRDENIYPEPERFIPERFTPEAESLRHPMQFLPFGHGPRNCIGARFAVYQSKLGIIKFLQNFKIEVSEKMQVPYAIEPRNFILTPVGGIHLKFKKLS